jgi:hypothetical protein
VRDSVPLPHRDRRHILTQAMSPIFAIARTDPGVENLIKSCAAEGRSNPYVLFGQRILSPVIGPLPAVTKRYKPVFTRLAVVKVSLRPASYQHVPFTILELTPDEIAPNVSAMRGTEILAMKTTKMILLLRSAVGLCQAFRQSGNQFA